MNLYGPPYKSSSQKFEIATNSLEPLLREGLSTALPQPRSSYCRARLKQFYFIFYFLLFFIFLRPSANST
jgi:hypothetical protein